MRTQLLVWVFIGFVLGFADGCAGVPTQYHVILDPSLDAVQMQAVEAGAVDWASKTPGLRLSTVVATCTLGLQSGDVCVATGAIGGALQSEAGGEHVAGTTQLGSDGWALVWLFGDWDDERRVVTHELGHAMGLHHTGPGTVMCATSECASGTVTPADVAQWENSR